MTRRDLLTRPGLWAVLVPFVLGGLLLAQEKPKVLHIGTTGNLSSGTSRSKEKAALKTLRSFIKEETGLDNKIMSQKDWQELSEKMAAGKLQMGVFSGDEFAWARDKFPKLQPLALGINVDRYPVVFVVTGRDSEVKSVAALRGKTIGMPAAGPHFLRTFLRHETGKKPEAFFSKIKQEDNVEDILDDVVDGKVQAAAVDHASLQAYRRRKPGRFKQLKELARSKPFPPLVVAYYEGKLDEEYRQRFRKGLLGAVRKEKGRMVMTLFRLTAFEPVPKDFSKVLARTRKAYPPPADDKTKR
jgi:ABC-type phosphate/phosphonate transport system substrate-binding protein